MSYTTSATLTCPVCKKPATSYSVLKAAGVVTTVWVYGKQVSSPSMPLDTTTYYPCGCKVATKP